MRKRKNNVRSKLVTYGWNATYILGLELISNTGWNRCNTNFYYSHDSIKLMPLFKVSVKMKFLFYLAGLTTIVTAKNLSQYELANYETKLRNYQTMTNIDEDTFQEIWTKGLENRKTLFKYCLSINKVSKTQKIRGKICHVSNIGPPPYNWTSALFGN